VKQAVILAGGKGTRLRERLGGRPKPLVDVCGTPLLERQMQLLQRSGFTSVLVLVSHAADQILSFCEARRNWGMDVRCIDDGEPRGTAGATLGVLSELHDEFLVMYGDTMLDVDLDRFHAYHDQDGNAAVTLLLHPNDHPHDSDLVETDDGGYVLAFRPYPHDAGRYYPNRVNAALYWIRRVALMPWRDAVGELDFGKHLFPAMLARGLALRGYLSPEYIKDLGTPERLDRVCADFRSGKIERSSLSHAQPTVFLDRDGTLNREVEHLARVEQLELLPGVPEALRRLNRSEYRCCVVTNQPVVARGECSFEDLRVIHNKLETLLGHGGAYLDRIYFCSHHPERGFSGERPELKMRCSCRKPSTGMVEQATRDLNVDVPRSWMIGDSTVDIEMARRAGLRSILVETGHAGMDYKVWAQPDFTAPDLPAAVEFILHGYGRLMELCGEFTKGITSGALVLIGGQSRSGKSTFAAGLREALRARGRSVVVLAADRWLHHEAARKAGVLGRYDLAALQGLVSRIAGRDAEELRVSLPGYHKLQRARYDNVESLSVSPSDIVVIEGTVSLALATSEFASVHRFHVQLDEGERKVRFLREYRLRGLDQAAALQLYCSRVQDEVPVLEALAAGARRLTLSFAAA
jgi:histidinol-phosphate phosphatase family protein